jgi:hypothetical protein
MTEDGTTPELRIGLLLDDLLVSKYVHEFVKWSRAHSKLQISRFILLPPLQQRNGDHRLQPSHGNRSGIISNLFFRLIRQVEKILLVKNKRHFDHLSKFDLTSVVPGGAVFRIGDDGINFSDIDLLIAFTDVQFETGTLPKFGLISVPHSEYHRTPYDPIGFWEVYYRQALTGFSIQGRKTWTDEREVLLHGRVGTQFYYLLNQASLFEKSSYYLMELVHSLALKGAVPRLGSRSYALQTRPGIPTALQAIYYLLGLARLLAMKLPEKMRGSDSFWHIGFIRSNWRNADFGHAKVIQNRSRHYLADPFVIRRAGKDICYVEEYNAMRRRGRIVVYDLGQDAATYLGVALEEEFHLSFPFLFEYCGELYMCPETHEKREIRIYKSVEFPLRWKLAKVIMRNITAVDSMLLERNGRWWMLTNIDSTQTGDFSLELHIFSAQSPLDEHWTPHPSNPLFIDASRARNGGIIRDGDRIFRVAQAQGFGIYGKRASINEIVELNENSYVERCVYGVSPNAREGVMGTHHLNANGAITVFDFASRNARWGRSRQAAAVAMALMEERN